MYLFIDAEYGSVGLEYSMLSLALVVADEKFELLKKPIYLWESHSQEKFENRHDAILDLSLKPSDGKYTVSAEGMSVNKIDLVEHDKSAITYKRAGQLIYDFISYYKDVYGKRLRIAGFGNDLPQIFDKLIGEKTWNQYCEYGVIDLSSVWRWLEITEKVPLLSSRSLGAIADYLGVEKGESHTALGDALTTLNCMKKIFEENK